MAARLVRGVKDLAQGVHVMPIGWHHLIGRILEEAGCLTRR